jgi:hypothetical protein
MSLAYLRDLVDREKAALVEAPLSDAPMGQLAHAMSLTGIEVDAQQLTELTQQVGRELEAAQRQELLNFLDGLLAREERRLGSRDRREQTLSAD